MLADNAQTGATTNPHLRKPFTLPRSIPKPIIAAINGACAGIGFVAAMNCDLRFASSKAKLTTSFVQRESWPSTGWRGRFPGSSARRSRWIPVLCSCHHGTRGARARRGGSGIRAQELMKYTVDYAKNLAQNSSPTAMGVIKRQVYAAQESSHEEARVLALRYWMGMLRHHPDFNEGITSYLDKRPPQFAPWDPNMPTDPPPLPTE